MTKKVFGEMVLYKLAGGIPDSSFPVKERDIWDALEHKVNELFKLRQLDTTLANGETIPEGAMIATYAGITVTASGQRSYATLPVIPISLPKGVGVFLVYNSDFPDVPYIPLQRGQQALLRVDELLNDLMGQVGFETKNNQIWFTKDLTLMGVTTVTMELCVFDISQYSITQDLPIPADYIGKLEDELVREFAVVLPESAIVNNFTNNGQTTPGNGANGK